jgi:hypothetical protein
MVTWFDASTGSAQAMLTTNGEFLLGQDIKSLQAPMK